MLRTERNVRVAVLFGSVARGEEHRRSDLDLLVSLADDGISSMAGLSIRLGDAVGREVQLVSLREARRSPMLLGDVLRDGRVLVDRGGEWASLKRTERTVERRARRAEAELPAGVASA